MKRRFFHYWEHRRDDPHPDAALSALLEAWQPRSVEALGLEDELQRRLEAHARVEAADRAEGGAWGRLGRGRRAWREWAQAISAGAAATPWSSPRAPLAGAVATLLLVAASGVFFHAGQAPPLAPTVQTAQTDAVVRDLQALDRESELLDNLDVLNGPRVATTPGRAN